MAEPILIIGGGLAGLSCALDLEKRGVPYRVFEASDGFGGRVRTDEVDGMRLDRGFQVYFTGYPHAKAALGEFMPEFGAWRSGAMIWTGDRQRTFDRQKPFATLLGGTMPVMDLLRLATLATDTRAASVESLRAMPDRPAIDELRARGFGERALANFFRPFFGGVFLDPSLGLSARQFLFVMKMLQKGQTASPRHGMGAIPEAMVKQLKAEWLHLNASVASLVQEADGRAVGIVLESGERIEGRRVVVATEVDASERLTGRSFGRTWLSSTCLYFTSERPVTPGSYLVLNGTGKGLLNEVAPLTNVAPELAPGRHLLSATVLGRPELDEDDLRRQVEAELKEWFPSAGAFTFVRSYVVSHGQLAQPPETEPKRAERMVSPGLVLAGEYVENCSIDGAIESGCRAAQAVLA